MELLVGTYTTPFAGIEANGDGIYSVSFDCSTGAFGAPKLLAECLNPSSLVQSPDGGLLFAGREVFADDGPALTVFLVESGGGLTALSQIPISGELPCHIAFDPIHNRLASAQYWTGDVVVSSVVCGVLQSPEYLTRTGHGPNAERQEGPHAHFVGFTDGGEVLHLVDLGTDSIVSHWIGTDNTVIETSTLSLPAGSGPRHMALTADETSAYVFCELDESLVSLKRDDLGWKISNVQAGFDAPQNEDGSGAAIRLAPDGRHVYLSGRRQSQIACFALQGGPKHLGSVGCGGNSPREILVTSDGSWVISANQASNSLTSLKRDPDNGNLTLSGYSCNIGSPVALIEFLEPQS